MHDLYARHNVKQLQKEMFRKEYFPRVSMNPQEANYAYLRGEVELVRLPGAEGRIAAEGALPYPLGELCVVLGEIWGGAVLRYFSAGRRDQPAARFCTGAAGCLYRRT